MKRLSTPIKDRLNNPLDEASLARIKAGVSARAGSKRAGKGPVLALAAAAVGVLGLVAWLVGPGRSTAGPDDSRIAESRASAVTLEPLTQGGILLHTSESGRSQMLEFDDGSSIQLSADTRLVPLVNEGGTLRWSVEYGRAEFDVRPGTGRRWIIEAARVSVEVVGTHFVVSRSRDAVDVSVQRGEVLVRADTLSGGVRDLGAGQSVHVNLDGASRASESNPNAESNGDAESNPDAESNGDAEPSGPTNDESEPTDRSQSEDQGGPASGARRPRLSSDSVERLLWAVDEARVEGRPRRAARLLAQLVARHPRDPRAPGAAFSLARLQLDVLDEPANAARSLSRALSLGLPRALREDARARLVEAYVRAGRVESARAALLRFEMHYPESRRRAEVQRWGRTLAQP